MSRRIVLYADEFNYDTWQTYCDILSIPYSSISVALNVTYAEPEFDEDFDDDDIDED